MLRRINDLAIFDSSRWPAGEAVCRVLGILAGLVYLGRKILQLPGFPGVTADTMWIADMLRWVPEGLKAPVFRPDLYFSQFGYSAGEIGTLWWMRAAIWVVETSIFVGYILAFLTRDRPRSEAKGFMEVVFPLIVAPLPFLISMSPYALPRILPVAERCHFTVLYVISGLLLLGGAITSVGLFSLRRAFTIMSEARTLIRRGPFRFVRHPLYLGQFIAYLGYTLLHLHWYTAALYAGFVGAQVVRARIEERKLAAAFPEYEEYRRTTGMFFPRLKRS